MMGTNDDEDVEKHDDDAGDVNDAIYDADVEDYHHDDNKTLHLMHFI